MAPAARIRPCIRRDRRSAGRLEQSALLCSRRSAAVHRSPAASRWRCQPCHVCSRGRREFGGRTVLLTSRLTLGIAAKFPIPRLPNARRFARRGRRVRQRQDRRRRRAVRSDPPARPASSASSRVLTSAEPTITRSAKPSHLMRLLAIGHAQADADHGRSDPPRVFAAPAPERRLRFESEGR